ncbi:hypothetical protein P8C59_003404 [Phyllachora maydis]|uniref:Uncharacterized protein n=1 Tax=Phyllachora maydis TaxID=1825666 RepID=A0AAD9I058_9PEZI|nr:hypothetical protein P8C59_003404 [Phyllachora maydis]
MADILEESRNPAIEAYRAAYVANSSNSTPNSNSNLSKKGKNKKKGKKKASYNIEGQNYSAKSAEQASFILGSYNLAIEEEEESDFSSNSSSSSDSNTQLVQLLALKGYKKRKDFKGKGLKTSSNKAKYKDNKPRRRPRDPALYNSWLYDTGSTDHISNSKERYNGNTVADLGPKLSNSSNTTTKLSRDFHSKEGPRPLTTTSTTIVDSRNSKGSSRTSIINSSLVPIGFSDSDFAGDKATSKSTYGYLYKLAGHRVTLFNSGAGHRVALIN